MPASYSELWQFSSPVFHTSYQNEGKKQHRFSIKVNASYNSIDFLTATNTQRYSISRKLLSCRLPSPPSSSESITSGNCLWSSQRFRQNRTPRICICKWILYYCWLTSSIYVCPNSNLRMNSWNGTLCGKPFCLAIVVSSFFLIRMCQAIERNNF